MFEKSLWRLRDFAIMILALFTCKYNCHPESLCHSSSLVILNEDPPLRSAEAKGSRNTMKRQILRIARMTSLQWLVPVNNKRLNHSWAQKA